MPQLLEVGSLVKSPTGKSYRVTDDRLEPGGQSRPYFVQGPGGEPLFLKMFTEPTRRSPEATAFVTRQLTLANRLRGVSDFVCRDIEFFEINGIFYKVSERMTGTTLQDRLTSASTSDDALFWPLSERLTSARVLAYTVSQLHDQGIAHLDLKPANCFLAARDIHGESRFVVRLMDFDGAVVDGAPPPSRVLGTDGYWSPEHISPTRYGSPGKPSDVFAMGIMLYEMLVGRYPFLTRDGFLQRRADHPSTIAKWLPEEVSKMIWQSLDVRPDGRPPAKVVHQTLLIRPAVTEPDSRTTLSERPAVQRLALVHDGPRPRRIRFHTDGVLGRDRLRGLDGYEAVSAEQARIYRQGSNWAITPMATAVLQSCVNGEALESGASRQLRSGDIVTVGRLRLRVDFEPLS